MEWQQLIMINYNKIIPKKREEGLSMLELLVTISILLTVIMVILVLGDRSVSQANYFSTQTQATFLAKEGMAIIGDNSFNKETIRDDTFAGDYYWSVDYSMTSESNLVKHSNIEECKNNLRIDNGFYNHTTGESSPFSRCITTAIIDNKHLAVTSNVYFDYKGEEQSIIIYRIFYFND